MTMAALVLDIETAVDRTAAQTANRTAPSAFSCPWLHRVVAVSTLAFVQSDFQFDSFHLETSLSLEPDEELGLLQRVDRRLAELGDDGLLLTWNGAAHDLPVLLQRRWHHWLFKSSPLHRLQQNDCLRHQDLMETYTRNTGRRWPALADVCACVGIPCHSPRPGHPAPSCHPLQAKSQSDVVATFLLHCFNLSCAHRSEAALARGWTAVADYLLTLAPSQSHLTPFVAAPAALSARERSRTMAS